MENKKQDCRPFGFRDKLGYLFGDFGNDFTFLLSSSFLLKFYTDVMGVPGYVVGIIMMVARFVDAFTDVAMGRICDRSRQTPVGKFKPWIRRMCGPVAISSFLIYQSVLARMSMGFKIVWLFVTYIQHQAILRCKFLCLFKLHIGKIRYINIAVFEKHKYRCIRIYTVQSTQKSTAYNKKRYENSSNYHVKR